MKLDMFLGILEQCFLLSDISSLTGDKEQTGSFDIPKKGINQIENV